MVRGNNQGTRLRRGIRWDSMDIQLPDSFTTPLQHIFAGQMIPTIYSDGVLDELYDMLQEYMNHQSCKTRGIDLRAAVHNNCLSALNRLIRKGKLGGTALCEVKKIHNGRFRILIRWAAVRTWTSWESPRRKSTGIKTQKWDATRSFNFTIG